MSDHRDDELPPDESDGAPPPPDEPGGSEDAQAADEPPEIQEMTPPPPGDDDATSAVPTPPPDEPAASDAPPPPEPPAAAPPPPLATTGPPPVVDDPATAPPGDGKQPWPGSAKALVAILVVLALAGIAGTIVGFVRASSAEDDVDATGEELQAERDRADAAEAEADELGEALLATTQERDELTEERAELIAERDAALAELEEAAAVGEAERALLEAEIAELEAQLEEVDEFLGELDELFPLSISFDLGQLDIAGTYAVSLTEIGCSGLDGLCGSAPSVGDATIGTDLRLTIPDTLDIPLTVVDGTPFGAADNETIVPPCNDVPRTTALTMALFDDAVEIGADGDVDVTALGATIVIDAPATEECGIGRVWYRAELTPR